MKPTETAYQLPLPLTRDAHAAQVATRRFAASRWGPAMAMVNFTTGHGGEELGYVQHLGEKLPVVFMRRLQILRVSTSRVFLYGESMDGNAGTWTLSTHGMRFRARLDRMDGALMSPFGNLPYGRNAKDGDESQRVILPQGTATMRLGSRVSVMCDGSAFVWDASDRTLTRWVHKGRSMTPIAMPVPEPRYEVDDFMGWNTRAVFLIRKGEESAMWVDRRVISFGGRAERFWTPPNDHSFAVLVRSGAKQALFLNGARVWSGVLAEPIKANDLRWSGNGAHIGVAITEVREGTGEVVSAIITSGEDRREIPAGSRVTEFVIDRFGKIAAHLLDSGSATFALIANDDPRAYERAWNLHRNDNGVVVLNTLLDERHCGRIAANAR